MKDSKQDDYYLKIEGNSFFQRNFKNKKTPELRPNKQIIYDEIKQSKIKFSKVLEYGGNYADLLNYLKKNERIDVAICIDASNDALDFGRKNYGDSIKFGCSELAVYHTPGHSKDGICLVGDGKIFSGDTLFVGNCGRIDLPGGSARELYHSLADVVANLSDDLVLYPGHDYGSSPTSTIGSEKRTNFVMQNVSEAEFVERMGG